MIGKNYDLDTLVTNALTRGYQEVKRYNTDDITVIFTAGNLAAKFWGYSYHLIAVGDVFEGGRIDWSKAASDLEWMNWKILSLDLILEEEAK
jgi:hypothetical protein